MNYIMSANVPKRDSSNDAEGDPSVCELLQTIGVNETIETGMFKILSAKATKLL